MCPNSNLLHPLRRAACCTLCTTSPEPRQSKIELALAKSKASPTEAVKARSQPFCGDLAEPPKSKLTPTPSDPAHALLTPVGHYNLP